MHTMRLSTLALSLLVALQPALAADLSINNLPAASSVTATDVFPTTQGGTTTRKATAAQISTYTRSQATKTDVGLGNVDNTSDANKPVSTATQTALDLKAPLASPALTGTPTAPTAAAGTNTTQLATTAGIVAERTATRTLTGATISGSSNTLSNIPDSALSANVLLGNGNPTITTVEPRILLNESDQGTDLKLWDMDLATGLLCLRTRTDADALGQNVFCATRGTTTTLTQLDFGNATSNPAFNFLGTGVVTMAGGVTTGVWRVSGVDAISRWDETDQGTNQKRWALAATGGNLVLSSITDANAAGTNILNVSRGTATAISAIAIGNATDNPTYSLLGTGSLTSGGSLNGIASQIASANPIQRYIETDQGADLKRWYTDVNGGVWRLRSVTDADATGQDVFAVTRGTTTAISSIVIGNNTGNPTTTFMGNGTVSVGGQMNARTLTVNNSDSCAVCINRPAANVLGFSTNSLARGSFDASGNFVLLQAQADQSKNISVQTTGFSQTIGNNISTQLYNPAGTLATGTTTMPATPIDGQIVRISSSQTITAWTLSANAGQAINNAPATLTAGQGVSYIYDLASTRWYRLQ